MKIRWSWVNTYPDLNGATNISSYGILVKIMWATIERCCEYTGEIAIIIRYEPRGYPTLTAVNTFLVTMLWLSIAVTILFNDD